MITDIANHLNRLAEQGGYAISDFQRIRTSAQGKTNVHNAFFGAITTFEDEEYAFHYGGRHELQYNIGIEEIDDVPRLRYGLAISYVGSMSMGDPVSGMEEQRKRFNTFLKQNMEYLNGFDMWMYRLHERIDIEGLQPIRRPIPGDFYFIGKLTEKPADELGDSDYEAILETFDVLLSVYSYVTLGLEERTARICWNTYNWCKPSGRQGKSTDADSHEYIRGYGHEEWLFDFDKLIDGYHYGFIGPIDTKHHTYAGRIFNISLLTYNSVSKHWYWIGRIKNLMAIGQNEAEEVLQVYKENGWIDEMEEQIGLVGADSSHFVKEEKALWVINVKFKPEDVELMENFPIPFQEDEKPPSARYTLFHGSKIKRPTMLQERSFDFLPNEPIGNKDGTTTTITKQFSGEEREYENLHAAIQNAFHRYLNEKYPYRTQREASVGNGSRKIDLKFKDADDQYIFYEVKSYQSLLTSVRVALGQLLEYAYFTKMDQPKELVIVSYEKATQEEENYLKHLAENYNLPLGYLQFGVAEGRVLQSINCSNV